jgi:hypothetical protein
MRMHVFRVSAKRCQSDILRRRLIRVKLLKPDDLEIYSPENQYTTIAAACPAGKV